jgi:CubicO group peptidase (beta-lactamase class C family)
MVLLALVSCSDPPAQATQIQSSDLAPLPKQHLVDRAIAPFLQKSSKGGLVIAFTNGSEHRFFSYGHVSEKNESKPDSNTIFEIGSLTKVFTSTLLVDLWRENKLSFDAPVRQFIKDVPDFNGKQITLFQLASHSSGLPRDPDNRIPHSLTPYGKEQFHAFLQHCTLNSPPGTKYLYSNAAYTLLGEIVENAGQSSYRQLLKERITAPLKMDDTMIALDDSRADRLAQCFDKTGNPLENSPLTGGPAGGLKSTASDLLSFLDSAISQEGSPLTSDISEACKRRFTIDRSESSCLGWFYNKDSDSFGKSGQTDGYSTCMEFFPSRHLGIVVLSSTLQLEAAPILRRCSIINDLQKHHSGKERSIP